MLKKNKRVLKRRLQEKDYSKLTVSKESKGFLKLVLKKEPKRYTVEDTLPYIRLLKNGICQLDERHFSKTVSFQDINYQLALDEDRDLIFNQFANFLNSFDPSVAIEFSYINQIGRNEEVQASMQIPYQQDGFDAL